MKNKAMNALVEMGMPANIKGFRYIAEAMALFEADEVWGTKMSMLYYKLSMMYNTTPSAVERSIRHAFSIVLNKGGFKSSRKIPAPAEYGEREPAEYIFCKAVTSWVVPAVE